ncbi:WD repeat-containing protein 64-like [Pelobates fuscus]|uniref:WD repeat-containing protein 64-like n=1 Tax=Pelobates fuscus TaxID=191477 RepID=UPI002FE4DB69
MASEEDQYKPFNKNTFKCSLTEFKKLLATVTKQSRLNRLEQLDVTQEDVIDYGQFNTTVKTLFGSEMKDEDIEAVFIKIHSNPDAPADWTEVFGYCEDDTYNIKTRMDERTSVLYLSQKKTIENATGGGKKKRDEIKCIVKVPQFDAVITASQKGTMCLFNRKV